MPIPGVMTRFRIDELSGVDQPAQKGARVAIMKRAEGEEPGSFDPVIKRNFSDKKRQQLADEGRALPDGSFPIENESDLHNAILAVGRAKNEARAKAHIIARAKAMGMSGALPDDWTTKGSDMDIALLRKALGLPDTATEADMQAAVAKNAKAAARAGWLATLAKARPQDRQHAKATQMAPEDEPDGDEEDGTKGEKAKKFAAFMAKSEAERDALIADFAKGDETLTANGVTISKRQVGDAMFAFAKAQAAQQAATDAALKKAQEDAANATFEKRATTEFSHVAGTLEERVAMLKGIAALPEDQRKAAEKALTVAEAAGKFAFSRAGGGSGPEGMGGDNADAKLTAKAKEIQRATAGMSFEKAYDKAASEHPDLYEASKAEQRERARAAN